MLGIIVCLTIVIAAAFVFRWLMLTSRWRVVTDDTCAKCGYIVIGLPGTICPECGSDLSVQGAIVRKAARPPLPQILGLLVWSLAFWAAYIAIEMVWLDRVPRVVIVKQVVRFSEAKSGAFQSICVDYSGEHQNSVVLSGQAEITLVDNNRRQGVLQADIVTGAYRNLSGPARLQSERGFNSDTILNWMKGFGIDETSRHLKEEVNSVYQSITAASSSIPYSSAGFSVSQYSYSGRSRATRLVDAARSAMILFWVIGCIWLWRTHRHSPHTPRRASVL